MKLPVVRKWIKKPLGKGGYHTVADVDLSESQFYIDYTKAEDPCDLCGDVNCLKLTYSPPDPVYGFNICPACLFELLEDLGEESLKSSEGEE